MKLITAFLIVCSASLLLATVSARDGMVATSKPSVDGKFGQSFTCSRFRPCPGNLCCSIWGHCGTGEAWCSPDTCQSNCWSSVKAVTAEEGTSGKELAKSAIDGKFGQSFRCSRIIPCPGNLCCSIWGHCGTGEAWCSPDTCQSNCWPSVKAVTAEEGTSGKELAKSAIDGKFGQSFRCSRIRPCPGNLCCSIWGHCGTGEAWCSPDTCQSNCWPSVKAVTAE